MRSMIIRLEDYLERKGLELKCGENQDNEIQKKKREDIEKGLETEREKGMEEVKEYIF